MTTFAASCLNLRVMFRWICALDDLMRDAAVRKKRPRATPPTSNPKISNSLSCSFGQSTHLPSRPRKYCDELRQSSHPAIGDRTKESTVRTYLKAALGAILCGLRFDPGWHTRPPMPGDAIAFAVHAAIGTPTARRRPCAV